MEEFQELDKDQRAVVENDNSLVVVAGPGSGKTRVLTEKARRHFDGGESVLCLTFTRAAAQEMASRVPGLPAATIHSFCHGSVGWKDEYGYEGLLARFIWDQKKESPEYRTRFDWVLVDECQDLNELELSVVLSLIGNKFFAVGDPFQSIYGFQGALGRRIVPWFQKAGGSVEHLKNNYRSNEKIVSKLEGIFQRGLVSIEVRNTGLTAILTRTNEDLNFVSTQLRKFQIPHRKRVGIDRAEKGKREQDIIGTSTLRISTIHCAKGLEFDKVILYGWAPDYRNQEETQVYYVAASRASISFHQTNTMDGILRALDGRKSVL